MLNAVTADLNSVDEAARKFYTERDGKFYLQVMPTDGLALENVDGLKRALADERTKHNDARRQATEATTMLEAWGDLDPVAARAALEATASGDVEAQVALRVESLRSGIAASAGAEAAAAKAELETTRATLKAREGQLYRLTKDAAIGSELDRLGPLDEAKDLLVRLASSRITLQESDGELVPVVTEKDGRPAVDATGKPVTIRAFLTTMRDERASLFKPTKIITGLGTSPHDRGAGRAGPGAGRPNPYAKATWNLTQQVLMKRDNPALASRMMAEAQV